MPDRVVAVGIVPSRVNATFSNGGNLSSVVELDGGVAASVFLPNSAGWTSAGLTFSVSLDGGKTFGDLYVDGAEYTITVPTGRINPSVFPIDPRWFTSVTHLRVRSGTGITPVNQGGIRAIQVGRMP